MSKWDGRYETSDQGKQSLGDDILDAGTGKITRATSLGGKYQETPHSINVYGPSDSEKGYCHWGYNKDTNESYGHE